MQRAAASFEELIQQCSDELEDIGWSMILHHATQRYYYYHEETEKVTWEAPTASVQRKLDAAYAATA